MATADERARTVAENDAEDLGFALSCLAAGAITPEELKGWIQLALEQSRELPARVFDLFSPGHANALVPGWRRLIGTWPGTSLSAAEGRAVAGIAHARFPELQPGGAAAASAALRESPAIRDRFARVFPSIRVPGEAGAGAETGDAAESGTGAEPDPAPIWWLAGAEDSPLAPEDARRIFVDRMAAGELTTMLESDAGSTLVLVTNRARMMIMLTGLGGESGHATDPLANGPSGGFLLDNGQEDEYQDRDTVALPRALSVIDHILTYSAPPAEGWSVDVEG